MATLLEMVQDILMDLESDEVTSISDTYEAEQVAGILKSTYYDIIHRRHWGFLRRAVGLESPGTNETPTMLRMTDATTRIEVVRYNAKGCCTCTGRDNWRRITWLDPEEFLDKVLQFESTCSNVEEMPLKLGDSATCVLSDNKIKIMNDKPPQYWTSFDDEYIVMDSYCKQTEDTLNNTNTIVWGEVIPDFTISDDFVADLPTRFYPLWENEAKVKAFYNLKGVQHSLYAKEARDMWIRLQYGNWRQDGKPKTPKFGR